jgi:hypothetical protein
MEQNLVRNNQAKLRFSLLSLSTHLLNFLLSCCTKATHFQSQHKNLPTLPACILISCLIPSLPKITIKNTLQLLTPFRFIDRIKFHDRINNNSMGPVCQNGIKICQIHSKKITFCFLSLQTDKF